MLEARATVRRLKEYHPPLGGREGLRLDFNENTAGCSPRVLQRLRSLSAEDVCRYPERAPLERLVAAHLGLAPEQVLLTNGVDEAIHLLCETYIEPGDEALITAPTFAMYEIYAAAAGARVITVSSEADFRFPAKALLGSITPRTRLIAVANPNNPTGAAAQQQDLLEITRRAPQAAVLVDEAYFDFFGETVLAQAGKLPNLFVARTFSKAYGMAGMRAGVLAGAAAQIRMVRRVSSPYNVNAVALACLPEALADEAFVRDYVAQVRRGRERLHNALRSYGIRCWPSQANFVLARLGAAREAFVRGMRARGILVRDRHRDPQCEGCVRIGVGTEEQTSRLLDTLAAVLEEIAAAKKVGA